MSFDATYDACVLHPAGLRDLLVRLAMTGLYRAHWSNDILDEMVASVLSRRPDLDEAKLERTRRFMCQAVPDSVTTGYRDLIEGLNHNRQCHPSPSRRADQPAHERHRRTRPPGPIRTAPLSSGTAKSVTRGWQLNAVAARRLRQ